MRNQHFQNWQDMETKAMRGRFDKHWKMVVAKYSLETEGVNLSGLQERAFESEKLMCDM